MSWVKRRGPSTPSPAPTPPVQMYNPNQHSTQENQWQNQQVHDNWYNQTQQYPVKQEHISQPQQNYWQPSYNMSSYNQNAQQHYRQQYHNQETSYYQNSTGYDQPYENLHYNQQYKQNNLYPTAQQNAQQNEGDSWNWAWGDEDNSNVQLTSQQSSINTVNQGGGVADAFTTDESWNWGVEDVKKNSEQIVPKQEKSTGDTDLFSTVENIPKQSVKLESDIELNKHVTTQDHLKVAEKRGKLDTPQWSTESQMSQESSDDVLHTSESDKSHIMSRSSTISHSPISGHEPLPSQNLDDCSAKSEPYSKELVSNQQFENKEILSNVKQELNDARSLKVNQQSSLIKNTQTPPLIPLASGTENPFKRTTGLSHKAANKFRASNATPPDSRQTLYQSSFHNQQVNLETLPDNSEQPDSVPNINQSVQKIKPVSQWPDNNEAPINDRNQYLETGHLSETNLNDYSQRHEVNIKQDINDALPPPGLRRMVPGQLEQNENLGNMGNFSDEPPPGLSRMVLGQPEVVANPQLNSLPTSEDMRLQYEGNGPPEGLRRMIPGESSSPESTLRHSQQRRADDSESEFNQLSQHASQPRSATIGADTPPTVVNSIATQSAVGGNRSETIGGGDSSLASQDAIRTRGANAVGNDNRNDKNRQVRADKKHDTADHNNRRDSIEGQTQENDVSNLTNSVRNLTVGENLTDGQMPNANLNEPTPRRHSRQETSDSDREVKKPPKSSRDKRSTERSKRDKDKDREKNRDRDRDRYSPDNYREKRYDKRRYNERRYEEDTDYYSDKEKDRRVRDDRDRDYDRKYSSLRKEKDNRYRRDAREYGRDRRGDYYYSSRYDDEYENGNRSRPSSRSDSLHESFRERASEKDRRDRRNRDKERDRYRKLREPRDMYNPYQGFSYDPYNPYYQQYQYYENLRRTNPQAYAEWYRKYYQQATSQASYGGEDRASVHSGRSSANDELAKDSFSRPFEQTDSLNFEENNVTAQRLTPAKFSTAHVKASISSGKLLRILPHYPMDGQNATVEVCNLQSLLVGDEEYKELSQFPGPLVKGVTHKKTIIEYCENKIRSAAYNRNIVDTDSYVLMLELLILLIRQNGMVVGTDIAELLLKNRSQLPPRPSSVISNTSSYAGDVNPNYDDNYHPLSEKTGSAQSVLKEEDVTNKFREYLLYGSGKEALEWAMKHGLWGHALFLASKLDKRTYANVMMRFANGLTLNDPLQTLYQLLSGKMPAAVTCVSDEKWGDWRPHLAMILSNSIQRPELNCKAITTLGDTLRNRGSLFAAQFCYLMSEIGFGGCDNPETRLVLLGADHSKPFPLFATNEAIHLTEIYEYACGLNDPNFVIPEFQVYKYLLATRLADRGLLEKSLHYLERVSASIVANPPSVQPGFVDKVFTLADKLKFYDPVGEVEDESEFGSMLETSRPDNSWLKDLRAVQYDFQAGIITHESVPSLNAYTTTTLDTDFAQQPYETNIHEAWQQQYEQQPQQNVMQQQQQWQAEQQQPVQVDYQQQEIQPQQQNEYSTQYQDQQNYWPNQQHQWGEQLNQYSQDTIDQPSSYYGSNAHVEDTPAPQISMPNQAPQKSLYEDEPAKQDAQEKKPQSPAKTKPKSPVQEKTQSTGWFGGIFNKLALKPKNQMKLPDDKNPKIVWDQDKKRWVNVDEDPNDTSSELKPPPKMSDLMPKIATQVQPAPGTVKYAPLNSTFNAVEANSRPNLPTSSDLGNSSVQPALSGTSSSNVTTGAAEGGGSIKPSQPNMFKLQRGRNLKNSYIDVFNPGGKPNGSSSLLPPDKFNSVSTPQMNFFIPQPVSDPNAPVDFLTPGGVPQLGEQQLQ